MTDDERDLDIKCIELVELVTEYLEGAVEDERRARIKAHLELCAPCAEYVEQMRLTIQHLGHAPLSSARGLPEPVVRDLLAAFRSEPGSP